MKLPNREYINNWVTPCQLYPRLLKWKYMGLRIVILCFLLTCYCQRELWFIQRTAEVTVICYVVSLDSLICSPHKLAHSGETTLARPPPAFHNIFPVNYSRICTVSDQRVYTKMDNMSAPHKCTKESPVPGSLQSRLSTTFILDTSSLFLGPGPHQNVFL